MICERCGCQTNSKFHGRTLCKQCQATISHRIQRAEFLITEEMEKEEKRERESDCRACAA